MEPSRRVWIRVLAGITLPVVIVLAVLLGLLAALAFYLRAIVLVVFEPFRSSEPAEPEAEPLAGPHLPAASEVPRRA